jgi:hypothetical protein
MSLRIAFCVLLIACSTSPRATVDARPDASEIPKSVGGIFRVTSQYELARMPEGASALLAELADATDSPDDPGRYLVERMIAAIADPQTRAFAQALEPLLAATVEAELDSIAPKLVPALVALSHGLERDARLLSTRELWFVQLGGALGRAVIGVTFDGVDIAFVEAGIPDLTANSHVTLGAHGELAIADHALAVPYGALLRLALDRALIPHVVPGATNLAQALVALVDCDRLGARVSTAVGFGSPAVYAAACRIGLTELADRWYGHLAAIDGKPSMLHSAGTAHGLDHDGDGAMDEITAGAWTGSVDGAQLGPATFQGVK